MSMGADPLGFLLGSTFGLAVLMCGLLLALIGVVWVERLADGAEQ
jgi:tight adherence protein B